MGRGLSDLQKTILRLALANFEKEGFEGGLQPAVTRDEVLVAHYGWKHREDVVGVPRRHQVRARGHRSGQVPRGAGRGLPGHRQAQRPGVPGWLLPSRTDPHRVDDRTDPLRSIG